jgi:hypothetical protein
MRTGDACPTLAPTHGAVFPGRSSAAPVQCPLFPHSISRGEVTRTGAEASRAGVREAVNQAGKEAMMQTRREVLRQVGMMAVLRTPTNRRWRSTPDIPRDKPLCKGLRKAARPAKTRETGLHGSAPRHGRHRVEYSPIIRTAGEPHRMFSGCSQKMWAHGRFW